jgi:hypothetical protein
MSAIRSLSGLSERMIPGAVSKNQPEKNQYMQKSPYHQGTSLALGCFDLSLLEWARSL